MTSSDFLEASAHLDSLGIDAMKSMRPSMHRIEAMLEALDHPERAIPALHVTGTNGKTSVVRIAASILSATGLSVGTFTSPHLESVRERIALGGEPIDEEAFGAAFRHLWPYLQMVQSEMHEQLTYFEVLTAMFFLWAAESPVDACVIEVGLGGRWDATNLIDAPVAVVTNIGLDHTGLLGEEKTTIAQEKAGIIKDGAVVVTGERDPAVLDVIRAEADRRSASMSMIDRDFSLLDNTLAVGGRFVSIETDVRRYDDLVLPLHGSHQGTNAAVALQAVTRFVPGRILDDEVVAEGFAKAIVPGRLEALHPESESEPTVILDVAHNPEGTSALVRGLVEAFGFESAWFVVGILGDKDYGGMLAELARVPCNLVLTSPKNVRAVPVEDLKSAAQELGLHHEVVDDVVKAVDVAMGRAGPADLVCVTGSHYVVGEARPHLLAARP
jgi:dihydrofolate synthase / folylpolyglutamate synthase